MSPLEPGRRGPVTAGLMLSLFMFSLDTTVVNVSLPQMQASLSASPEQITWVVTSVIVAMAVATPISGWLAARIGVKTMLLTCVALFTVTSVLCGLATSLPEIVLFRILQGATGAPMMPLSQAVMFNINPPERYGRAMALYTMAAVASPIVGPVLGAYLTETLSWRWCFFVNVPAGIGSLLLLWTFLPRQRSEARRFDFLGFGSLAVGVASLQLMLDRGTSQDWFASPEIWVEAVLAASGFWTYLTHTLTAKQPLFHVDIWRDRNFVSATGVSFFTTMLFFASLTLLPLMMQTVLGYPVMVTGLLSIPRGLVMMGILQVLGRIDALVDRRLLLAFGLVMISVGFWHMAQFDLSMAPRTIVIASIYQALGQAVITVPTTTLAMTTVRPELRAEASALNNLARSVAGSVGVAVLQAMTVANGQRMHEALAAYVRPEEPVFRSAAPPAVPPGSVEGLVRLNEEISRQAMMVAYVDDFRVMGVLALCGLPLLLLMRPPRRAASAPAVVDAH